MGHALSLLLVLWHYGEDIMGFPLLTGHLDSGRRVSNRVLLPFPFGLWIMAAYPEFKRGFISRIYPVLKNVRIEPLQVCDPGAQRKTDEPGVQVVSIMRSDTICYGLNCVPLQIHMLKP